MRISHKDKTDLPRKRDHLEHKERRHLFFQRNLHQLQGVKSWQRIKNYINNYPKVGMW